jgi:glycosyltransferase involved in cell wall biosynthesis
MSPARRILYATSGTAPGCRREALQASQAARALARFYDMDVLCPMLGRSGHVMDYHGARLMRVPMPDGGREAAEALDRAMRRQLADGLYDVVHVRTPVEGRAALEMRDEAGFLLVHEPSPPSELICDLASDPDALENLVQVESDLVRAADVVVVHGYDGLDRARALRGSDEQVLHVPPGVDVDCFAPMPLRPASRDVLMVLGEPELLGLESALEMRGVDELWGKAGLELQGPGDLALALCGVRAFVALPPCGCPAWIDCLPDGILEAAATMTPLVAPRLDGVIDLLGQEASPLLYDPTSGADATRVLDRVLGSLVDLGPLMDTISERVSRHFPASAMRARLVTLYASLVHPRSDMPAIPVAD